MELKTMTLSCENQIATIIINALPVNSITPQVIDDLETVFDALADMDDVRAVVLASGLEKIFVAGADINQFISWKKADGIAVTRRGHDVFLKIADYAKPVICALNGIAYGGGLELALACDIRVIDRKAKVGLPEVGLGIVPGYGGTQRLPQLVGPGMAKKLILTGKPVDGEEAYRIGIAEVLAEPGTAMEQAQKLARDICGNAPIAVTAGKNCVKMALTASRDEGITYEIESVGVLCTTEDKTEGAKAFVEKRSAVFKNK